MPRMIREGVLSWATDLDEATIEQAARTAHLPIVADHVALMPDAHLGYGSTVGSVIPTTGAIIPAAVGVDIGCGMTAVRTDRAAADLPDSLDRLLSRIEEVVPAGVGRAHESPRSRWYDFVADHGDGLSRLSERRADTAARQFGTLGSGNHFVEVCLDEADRVWIVLHSGSRGVGNQLAQQHIASAKGAMARYVETGPLDDPDLAYLVEGTAEFDAYVRDLVWAQAYAFANRDEMMDAVLGALFAAVPGREVERVACHHNYAQREDHLGQTIWVTRKGAIRAREGDRGVIPGSMGTASYIVTGLGEPSSFSSAAHGAGRRLSRRSARRTLSVASLDQRMAGRAWRADKAAALLDEHPDAYKDIDEVMAAQSDLVRIDHTLRQVLNYKGT